MALDAETAGLAKELGEATRADDDAARLMTISGVGPVTAMALRALAPPLASFRRSRDFAAWLGHVPRQHTTGGKWRLGGVSKRGQRGLRRLLIAVALANRVARIVWAMGTTKQRYRVPAATPRRETHPPLQDMNP